MSALLLAAVFPTVGLIVCSAILLIQIALLVLRPIIAFMPARMTTNLRRIEKPHFSVHVATHAEPPHLVIRTLQALLDQDWPERDYEIIVMDNNTEDPSLWMPVKEFCDAWPYRITFLHQTGVEGAKAGALNIALEHTDPEATHIVTVDADYVVNPDFLTRASRALQRTGADFVQFPQSYIATTTAAPGVDAELDEYFRTNAAVADEAEAVLLTGTLCVISKPALVAAGGWSGSTTTEDAELGVRLCNAGFSGRFINQVVGRGLLPLSLNDLEKQRYRWCSGNFQTLLRHGASILTASGAFTLHKRLVILSQLTAWFNLALIPFVLLTVWMLTGRQDTAAVTIAAAAIVLSLCDITVRVVARGWRDRLALPVVLQALACRIALAPQSAKATFDGLIGSGLNFVVTDKSGAEGKGCCPLSLGHLLIFLSAVVMLVTVQPANPVILAALLVLMLPLLAASLTDQSLRNYRETIALQKTEVSP
ncbi:glycosyltransferase family 2 protein [Gymnodinialimonas ceratoperidinii]|uniref:Beta-monoglucosyldiacylglycerol synthase n=1 Tax=Gymnodinialimonas ceratoperidinii TaxID=2856823 RepID=A0A8F6TVP4_9RHOB|nr:glycosyltransferase [Gymnodinialimonas ceratoperidinii]QXT39049.1 glycosyltransferase [Gymnodinialimonas ceratoperidinii]